MLCGLFRPVGFDSVGIQNQGADLALDRHTGLCVGIAPTKTLAKYCNHLAKKIPALKRGA